MPLLNPHLLLLPLWVLQMTKKQKGMEFKPKVNMNAWMEKTQVWVPFERIATEIYYRLEHKSEVALRKRDLLAEGYMMQHPMVVKRRGLQEADPENKGTFDVVDGMHRMEALWQIYLEYGKKLLDKMLGGGGMIHATSYSTIHLNIY